MQNSRLFPIVAACLICATGALVTRAQQADEADKPKAPCKATDYRIAAPNELDIKCESGQPAKSLLDGTPELRESDGVIGTPT